MNLEPMQKAAVLIEALPYIQRFNRKIVVLKSGGSAMVDEELKKKVIQDVVLLKLVGFKPIIVHGGGKEISRWVGKVGMEAQFKNGLRVTDEPTMEIAEMVLNKVNKSLVQLVSELGINAVGISGKDGMMLKCRKKYAGGEDIGFVGDVEEVNPKIIYDLLEKDFLPIICPIGFDEDFLSYNINADDAACAIATAVEAEKLAFLTDVEGVYKDYEDKSSLISEMTVEEALPFFENLPRLYNKLQTLYEVGLSYVKLGQPSTTLSGGEAQRVKLATELAKRSTGKTIYILDEPTTGLHTADVHKLIEVLQKLVDVGNTVVVIEHNLDVIKTADHIIDLGPEGGDGGGNIVVTGTPEEVARCAASYTGQYLKRML